MDDRDGELAAFVRSRGGALLRTAVFLCAGDEAAGEDLLQSSLIKLYVSWEGIRDPVAREAYARRIMVRLSYRRDLRTTPRAELPDVVEGDHAVGTDARVTLLPYLRLLPPRQRAVIVLRYYDDLSEHDIAAAMGCSAGTVKTHAARAIHSLRRWMDDTSAVTKEFTDGH